MAPVMYKGGNMQKEQMVSIQQIKDALTSNIGSRFPVKITLRNGDVLVRYVRGFADQQTNILLISDNAHTLALRILEIKEITTLEFGMENSGAEWKVLHVKSSRKPAKI